MTGLFACASHLLVDLPLFGGPVLFVVAAVALISRSERRRAGEEGPSSGFGAAAGPDGLPSSGAAPGEKLRTLYEI
jgi:hypothetical protein